MKLWAAVKEGSGKCLCRVREPTEAEAAWAILATLGVAVMPEKERRELWPRRADKSDKRSV